jgi:hypothetical protein
VEEAAQAGLARLATEFGPAPLLPVALRWGLLHAEVGGDERYIEAIELVHEGYLLHYRDSRVIDLPSTDRETALLAGDVAYARGLRGVAERGDLAGVTLLARLMSACSLARDEGRPFVLDDALWAYAVAAMAATLSGSCAPAAALLLFDEVDDAFAAGQGDDLIDLVDRAVGRLGLEDLGPLRAALAAEA